MGVSNGGLYCNDFIVTSVKESGETHTLRSMMIFDDIEHDIGNANKASHGVEPIKEKLVEILVKITTLTFIK